MSSGRATLDPRAADPDGPSDCVAGNSEVSVWRSSASAKSPTHSRDLASGRLTLGLYRNCSPEDDHVVGRQCRGSSFDRAVRRKPMVRQIRGAMGFQCGWWTRLRAFAASDVMSRRRLEAERVRTESRNRFERCRRPSTDGFPGLHAHHDEAC